VCADDASTTARCSAPQRGLKGLWLNDVALPLFEAELEMSSIAPQNPLAESFSSEGRAALTDAIRRSIPALATTSTVALVDSRSEVIRQRGSGTLIAVADQTFVLTAAHVVRHAKAAGATLGVSSYGSKRFVAVAGKWIMSSGGSQESEADPNDVAVYELSNDQRERLTGCEFVRIADVSFLRDISNGYFVVIGFPGIWSTVLDGTEMTMKSRLLQYGTYAFSGNVVALAGYDERRHFLLQATPSLLFDQNGEQTEFRTRSGFAAKVPDDLGGISGCSVWLIGDVSTSADTWAAQRSRLIGIETGVYNLRGAIKATRWNAVISLLYKAYPHLRASLDLHMH